MPRPLRPLAPGLVYHVTAHALEGRVLFRDDRDRQEFLGLLAEVVARFGWRVLAWCLLDNHFHLLVETPDPNLSAGMQRLNGVYAQRFNRRHDVRGPVFQGRFYSGVVGHESHLFAALRYIALNPVAAHACTDPAAWRWSSHATTCGGWGDGIVDLERAFDLLSGFGDPATTYRNLVASGLAAPLTVPAEPPPSPLPPPRPSVRALVEELGVDAGLRSAIDDHGHTIRSIAKELGDSPTTIARRVARTRT